MKRVHTSCIALIAPAAVAVSAPAASAQTREYEGTVVSVNRDARTFRLRDSERGTVRVRVTNRTRFERISGFAGLRDGQTNIETTVRRSNGRWVALEVERRCEAVPRRRWPEATPRLGATRVRGGRG